jgi:hypothetical protein
VGTAGSVHPRGGGVLHTAPLTPVPPDSAARPGRGAGAGGELSVGVPTSRRDRRPSTVDLSTRKRVGTACGTPTIPASGLRSSRRAGRRPQYWRRVEGYLVAVAVELVDACDRLPSAWEAQRQHRASARPGLLPRATVAGGVLRAHVPRHGRRGGADDVRAKAWTMAGRARPREESERQGQPDRHDADQPCDYLHCCRHHAPPISPSLWRSRPARLILPATSARARGSGRRIRAVKQGHPRISLPSRVAQPHADESYGDDHARARCRAATPFCTRGRSRGCRCPRLSKVTPDPGW